MKFLGYRADSYKSIENQSLPLERLTVLFGVNGSGKSNLLEALLVVNGDVPPDVGRYGPEWDMGVLGDFFVDLEEAHVPGTHDWQLYDDLLHSRLLEPDERDIGFLDGDIRSALEGEDRAEVLRWLSQAMVESTTCGDLDDRRALADELAATTVVRIGHHEPGLIADPSRLTESAREAARRLATASGDDDLVEMARAIASDQHVEVECFGPVYVYSDRGSRAARGLVPSRRLDLDQHPDVFVEAHLTAMAHLIRHENDMEAHREYRRANPTGTLWRLYWPEEDPWLAKGAGGIGALEALAAAATHLAAAANRLLPSFLEGMVVHIDLVDIAYWSHNARRVTVRVSEGDEKRPILSMGAGVARWVTAAVAVAAEAQLRERHEALHRQWHDPDGFNGPSHTDWLDPHDVGLRPQPLWLVDEPEAHLHPGAVRSVVQWLIQLGKTSSGVVVATHHPLFLSLRPIDAQLVHVRKANGKTTLEPIAGRSLIELDRLAREAGCSRAELLAMGRVALFVEGPHEVAVLDGMVGSQLADNGVFVFPIHGTYNLEGLIDSEVVRQLGLRLAVLTDNTDPKRAGGPVTAEERGVARLVSEARAAGQPIKAFGLHKRDIVEYLDEDACRREAPGFPGWQEAARAWKADGRPGRFKQYVTERYQLPLDRDSVYRLAALGAPDPAIELLANDIILYANRNS